MRTFILPQNGCRIEVLRDKLYKAGLKYPSMDVQWRKDTDVVEVAGDWVDAVADVIELIVSAHTPDDLLPEEEDAQLDVFADAQIGELVGKLKNAGLFQMSATEIFDDIQGRVDAIGSLAEAKAFLGQVIPFLVTGVIWIIRRLLTRK